MTRLGYLIPTREQIMQDAHGTAELLDRARFARDLGIDSLWVGDSLFARPRHDPLTLLAAIATAAPGVALGTAILLSALRNPVLLAQQLATIDQLSDGQLIVGVGIGADAPAIRAEFAAAGVPFEKRVGRLVEGLQLCKALWQGEPVTWNGRWQLEDVVLAPRPVRPGGPLIGYASSVDAGVRRAARWFDRDRWCDSPFHAGRRLSVRRANGRCRRDGCSPARGSSEFLADAVLRRRIYSTSQRRDQGMGAPHCFAGQPWCRCCLGCSGGC